jgi:hypothetical protein
VVISQFKSATLVTRVDLTPLPSHVVT